MKQKRLFRELIYVWSIKQCNFFLRGVRSSELNEDESLYFEYLVCFNQSRSLVEKEHWFLKMIGCKKINRKILNPDVYEYFSKWYYAAIREIIYFYDKTIYPNVLAEMLLPKISTEEAVEALKLLNKLGLIEKNSNGRYLQKENILSTGNQVHSFEVAKYQIQTIDLAKLALESTASSQREISTLTISLSDKAFHKINDVLHKTKNEIIKITQNDNNENQVYQLNIQFFPLTVKMKKEE